MNYDRNSFLSGVAVGRQLKGWGATRTNGGGEVTASASFSGDAPVVLNALLSVPAADFGAAITVSDVNMEENENG